MPIYEVEDPQGRKLELEGDHDPTEQELQQIFSSAFPKEDHVPQAEDAFPKEEPAQAEKPQEPTKSLIPEAMLPQKRLPDIRPPEWTQTPLIRPEKTIPAQLLHAAAQSKLPGAGVARVAEAIAQPGMNLLSGLSTPENIAIAPAAAAAPAAFGAVFGAMAIPSAWEGLKQVKEALSEGDIVKLAGGLSQTGVSGLIAAGGLGGALAKLPHALRETKATLEAPPVIESTLPSESVSSINAPRKPNIIQAGAQTKPESGGSTGTLSKSAELQTSFDWLQSIERGDRQASENAASKLLGIEMEAEQGSPPVLGSADIGGATVRTPITNVSETGTKAQEIGTRTPPESQRAGQQDIELDADRAWAAFTITSPTTARKVVNALSRLRNLRNEQEASLGARSLFALLSKKIPENAKNWIVKEIKDIAYARKNFSAKTVHGDVRTPPGTSTGEVPIEEGKPRVRTEAEGGIPEAPAVAQAEPAVRVEPTVPEPTYFNRPLSFWRRYTKAVNVRHMPADVRNDLVKYTKVEDKPGAIANFLEARIAEVEQAANKPTPPTTEQAAQGAPPTEAVVPLGEGGERVSVNEPEGAASAGEQAQVASPAGGWFHASHKQLNELAARPVESVDSLGTWVTSSQDHAKTLYAPNVYRAEVPKGLRLLEFDGSDPKQIDFNRVLGSNAQLAKEVGLAKEARILNKTLPDTKRYSELNYKSNTEGLRGAEWEEFKRLRASENASRTLLRSGAYMQKMRAMLQSQGYEGIIWKNSRIDTRKTDTPHDVAVIFNKEPIKATPITNAGGVSEAGKAVAESGGSEQARQVAPAEAKPAQAPPPLTPEETPEIAAEMREALGEEPPAPEAKPTPAPAAVPEPPKMAETGTGPALYEPAKNWVKQQSDAVRGFLSDRMQAYDKWKAAKTPKQKKLAKIDLDSRDRELAEAKRIHEQAVREALAAGKPVPQDVLADYPDLKATVKLAPEAKAAAQVPAEPQRMAEGPGAAGYGQVGTYNAIDQLSDRLRTVPSTSKADPVKLRDRMAEGWAKGKGALARSVAMVRSTAESIKNFKWPTGMRTIDDVERSIAKLDTLDQQSILRNTYLKQDIGKTYPSKIEREAAALLQDSGGDTRQYESALPHLPPKTPVNIRKAMEMAANPNENVLRFRDFLNEFFGARLQDAQKFNILKKWLGDYFTHIWKKEENMPDKLRMMMNMGKVNTFFRYGLERKISTFLEGILNGKVPNLDPMEVVPHYSRSLDKTIISRQFVKRIHEINDTVDGRPVLAPDGVTATVYKGTPDQFTLIKPRVTPAGTADFLEVDHPSLRGWKYAAKNELGNPVFYEAKLLVHPNHYKRLSRMLDRRLLTPSKFTRVFSRVGGEMKAFKFGLASLFHQVHVSTHGVTHEGNVLNLDNHPWIDQSTGRIIVDHPMVVRALEKGHVKLAPEDWELNAMSEGIMQRGALIQKIPFIGPWSRMYSEYLFRDRIPKLKLVTFANALPRNIKKLGGKFSLEQIEAKTGEAAETGYGELNRLFLGKYGRDPRFQRLLNNLMISADFTESRFNFVRKAFTVGGTEERLALRNMVIGYYLMARVGNLMASGDPHWSLDDPKHMFSVKIGDHWYSMRSVIGDLLHAGTDFRNFLTVRIASLPRGIAEIFQGIDQRGRKRTHAEVAQDIGNLFVPIQLQGLTSGEKEGVENLLTSMGIVTQREIPEQQIHDLARRWAINNSDPRIRAEAERREKMTLGESVYQNLRKYLRQDEIPKARAELVKLLQTHTRDQIATALRPSRPITGSWDRERRFRLSLDRKWHELYRQAEQDRRREYQRFLTLSR